MARAQPRGTQRSPGTATRATGAAFWRRRYDDINTFERHRTRSGTLILKCFLNLTSRAHAPWYGNPADHKAVTRMLITQCVVQGTHGPRLYCPRVTTEQEADPEQAKRALPTEATRKP